MKDKNIERIADIFAMVTFSYVTGMLIEIFYAGMTLEQSFTSRNASVPLNLITARMFGVYRNYLLRRFQIERQWLKVIVDLISFISFQIPIYIIVLTFAGASGEQIYKAVSGVVLLFLIMGPPYGYYLDSIRKLSFHLLKSHKNGSL